MSAYISVELQRQIRDKFSDCCAYCLTAEFLTATTFEFEHIIPRFAKATLRERMVAKQVLKISV